MPFNEFTPEPNIKETSIEDVSHKVDTNWQSDDGTPDGGVSTGVGYTISWQRGTVSENGRNGAFLIEVLESCRHQLEYYQTKIFNCEENANALTYLNAALEQLYSRRNRRKKDGILDTHKPDLVSASN